MDNTTSTPNFAQFYQDLRRYRLWTQRRRPVEWLPKRQQDDYRHGLKALAFYAIIFTACIHTPLAFLLCLVALVILFLLACLMPKFPETPRFILRRYERVVSSLATTQDVLAIPSLAELYCINEASYVAKEALLRLLPGVSSEDANLWSLRERQSLYRLLEPPFALNVDLQIAVLKALEKSGDSRTLAVVEELLAKNALSRDLEAAAQACCAELRAQQTEMLRQQTLLRAADMPAPEEQQLLRAGITPAETSPLQLLRASETEK